MNGVKGTGDTETLRNVAKLMATWAIRAVLQTPREAEQARVSSIEKPGGDRAVRRR